MFKTFFTLCLFATTVFAQAAFIGLPTFNQTVYAGTDLIVQVQSPDSLTSVEQVAVAIGLESCPNTPACGAPSGGLGIILYYGLFDPQFHGPGVPYENFTVQIPSTVPAGTAAIAVAHFALVGDGNYPLFETLNQTITIA
ncbi:hypothetical protein EV363DRAFT_1362959 [Boletus edulis]|uniref:Uncharacterized protein n=1 Tax=Boletus edulis BED1 TaxID=1328754 RepID=A0AAD4C3B1_BOLED|nr:hypothetical protein EV363DRAFT_1362959 [Boletus edulis]KAF8447152.1 hypothetical protein L210DRAFT_932237 [Boletus edulis BED1]